MTQLVRAYGQILRFPKEMSDDAISKAILDNEHDLNPDYKPPAPSKIKDLAKEYLGVDVDQFSKKISDSRKSIADRAEESAARGEDTAAPQVPGAPVRQSTYNDSLLNARFGIRPQDNVAPKNLDQKGILGRIRKTADEDVRGQEFQENLRGAITDAPPEPEGGFIPSAASIAGRTIKGVGRIGSDYLGYGADNSIAEYGQKLIDENPVAIKGLEDIQDKPFLAIREALGMSAPTMGGMVGAKAIGLGITSIAPLTGPAAPIIAAVGTIVQWLGPAAVAALPSYSSIRDKQILNDPTNEENGKAKAIAAVGSGAIAAIETAFGPQNWAMAMLTKEGRAVLARKFAATTTLGAIAKGGIKGSGIEFSEEIIQNPVEQLASFDDPTTKENIEETIFGGAMGAIGGGVMGGGIGGANQIARNRNAQILIEKRKLARQHADAINRRNAQQGHDDILNAGSVDDAIKAANSATSREPVTKDDVLRTIDPTLADIERLTGLKPSESIEQAISQAQQGSSSESMSAQGRQKNIAQNVDIVAQEKPVSLNDANEYAQLIKDVESRKNNSPDTWTSADEKMLSLAKEKLNSITQQQGDIYEEKTSQATSAQKNAGVLGSNTEIVLPNNTTLPAQWQIVDADNIKATIKEGVNQPRDRTRAASDIQIQGIANNPDYRRLSDSPVMDIGAPVLDRTGAIVAGNGRFDGLSKSYGQGSHAEYLGRLKEDAANKGIDPAIIDTMKKPILVRRITQPFDTKKLAIASNSGTSLQYSGLELAKIDAGRMSGIEDLDITDGGDIALIGRNAEKIKQSLGNYSATELSALVDKDGSLSQDGVRRIRNAVLSKAYGNSPTLGRMVESTDSDIRNVLSSLTKSASVVAKVRSEIAAGSIPMDIDITDNLLGAVETLSQIKAKGQPLDQYLSQDNIFGDNIDPDTKEILQFLHDNVRSQKKLTEFIKHAYDQISRIDQSTENIFGDKVVPSKQEIIRNAKQSAKGQPAESQQGIFAKQSGTIRNDTGLLEPAVDSSVVTGASGASTPNVPPIISKEETSKQQDIQPTQSLTRTASWVVKEKTSGKVLFETFDKKKVDALNTEKYEAVPILDHLASLNRNDSKESKTPADNAGSGKEGSQGIKQKLNTDTSRTVFGRFSSLGNDKGDALQAMYDAEQITGLKLGIPIEHVKLYDLVPARFDLNRKIVEVNTEWNFTKAEGAQFLAEEILHYVDSVTKNKTISSSSKLLNWASGEIAKESQLHYQNYGIYSDFLQYPIDVVLHKDLTDNRREAELFARLGVLYFGEPDKMAQSLPIAYKVYHGIFKITSSPVSDEISRKIWSFSPSPYRKVGVEYKSVGSSLSSNGSFSGDGNRAELDRLREAIGISFRGKPSGSETSFSDESSLETKTRFSRSSEERLKDRERSRQLERKLREQGYNFTIQAKDVRDFAAMDRGRQNEAIAAEQIAKVFGKRIVWIEAIGDFRLNGVMVPRIKDSIFIDVTTEKYSHAVMGHELSHHMEHDAPAVYRDLVKSLEKIIKDHGEYAKKYNIEGVDKSYLAKEIVGDIMGDNFTDQKFWKKVAEYNPSAFRRIADTIISWLKNLVIKARSRGLGSERWVTDAKKAQDIIAKAVAQYTNSESSFDGLKNKPMFQKAWHGSPYDHDKFDSSKIGTGEGAQAYGFGLYFSDSKDVAGWYKEKLSSDQDSNWYDRSLLWNGKEFSVSELQSLGIINTNSMSNVLKEFFGGTKQNFEEERASTIEKLKKDKSWLIDNNKSQERVLSVLKSIEFLGEIKFGDAVNKAGKLYEVELVPTKEEYLLWDKPLSEQSDKVKSVISSNQDYNGADIISWASETRGIDPARVTGELFYGALTGLSGSDKAASKYLHSLGIRGIKYLDGSSRHEAYEVVLSTKKGEYSRNQFDSKSRADQYAKEKREEGFSAEVKFNENANFNYVIFDDEDVSITAKFSKAEKDYKMEHKSPGREGNATLSDLTGNGNIYPDDVYSNKAVEYYGTGNNKMDRQSFEKAKILRGKPDAMVDIYRAAPKGIAGEINPGYWVTINKAYAKEHGESYFDGKYDILSKKVRAGDIFTNGDSIHEWGYEPEAKFHKSEQDINIQETINIDGVDRPTRNSEGKLIHPTEEGIRNFWEWFGDSKITDDQDRPLVVYHGTGSEFAAFKLRDRNYVGRFGDGFYFSEDKKVANFYAENSIKDNKMVMPLYLKIENPIVVDSASQLREYLNNQIESISNGNLYKYDQLKSKPDSQLFREIGYDGVIYKFNNKNQEIVAFDPNQIKSAIGNTGAFSKDNPDIRFSKAEGTRRDIGYHVELISKYAEQTGWMVINTFGSELSGSQYIDLKRATEHNKDGEPLDYDEVKIRVSDHELPPTYKMTHKEADFEVTPDGVIHSDSSGDWVDALIFLSEKSGIKPKGRVTRYIVERLGIYAAQKRAQQDHLNRLSRNQRESEKRVLDGVFEKELNVTRSGSGKTYYAITSSGEQMTFTKPEKSEGGYKTNVTFFNTDAYGFTAWPKVEFSEKQLIEFNKLDDNGRARYIYMQAKDKLIESIKIKQNRSAESQDIKFSKAEKVDTFYSQLQQVIEDAPDKVFSTGKQTALWLQENRAKLEVKEDELNFSRVLDYLQTQGKVSKDDVLEYLHGNNVSVQEVVLYDNQSAKGASPSAKPKFPTHIPPDGKPGIPLFSLAEKSKKPPIPESKFRKFQRFWQDDFNRFVAMKEWLAERGINLSEQADVSRAEERFHSKVANQIEDFRDFVRNPLIEKIAKAGFSMSDVADYLEAQHAEEANAAMQKLHKDPDITAYGITDDEAGDYLAKAPKELGVLANEFRNITEQSKKLLLDNGLRSQEEIDAWEGAYKHYIPVKGSEQPTKGTGKGLSVQSKTKRRLGHGRRDEAVIENILLDHERAIMEVEKNRVAKHLGMMAAEIAMSELMTIGQPVKRKVLKNTVAYEVKVKGVTRAVFDSKDGANTFKQMLPAVDKKIAPSEITINPTRDQRVISSASPMLAENEINMYIDGHAIRIQINDEIAARAYKHLGIEGYGHSVAAGRAINGYLSKIYTGYAPEWGITNVIRDFTSGIINLTGEEGIMMTAKAIKNYPASFASLLRYSFTSRKKSTKWIDMYRTNGGNTGAAYLPDMERLGNDVASEYAAFQGVIANIKQGDMANASRAALRKLHNVFLKWLNNLNQASENAMRLAAFKAMIESGKTVNEASHVAKNITINFNKKGEFGQTANAAYLFFNATMNGQAAMNHALFKGKHKYQALALGGAGLTALGFTVAAMLGGGDEDEYDRLDDYTKERNMVIKSGDGWVKIPVPYGYGFFWNMGRAIADAQRKDELGLLPWHIAASAIEELTPFGSILVGSNEEFRSDQVLLGLLPTVAQIAIQPALNKSIFTGGEMMPESPFDQSQPDRDKMFRGTKGTVYDNVAGWMKDAGMDVSPETLKHLTRSATGGAGSTADTSISFAMLKAEGAELDANEVPFVRKLYHENTIRNDRAAFQKARKEARTAAEEFRRANRDNDLVSIDKILKDKHEMLLLDNYANKLQKFINLERDEQDAIRTNESIPVAEKRLKLKELEAKEAKFYDEYLDVFKIDKSVMKGRLKE